MQVIGNRNRARVSTAFHPNTISKLKAALDEYSLVKGNRNRDCRNLRNIGKTFTNKIHLFFYIAHKNVENTIRTDKDIHFFNNQ